MKPSRRAASLSVAAALLAALAGRAGAQQQEAALPAVTLDDAVKLALVHSPLMVQARGSVREADAETRSSWGAFLPTLSLSSGASRASSTRFNSATNTVVSGSAASYTAGLSGGLDIFSGGRRTAVLRQARAASDAADASLVQQRYQVALNAESGFFDVLRAADLIRVAQSQVQMAQEQLDASNQRLKVGSATRSDVLRAQLSLTQANQALAQAETQRSNAQYALGRLVGMDGPVDATPPASLEPKPLAVSDSELVQMADEQAPSVTAAEAAVKTGQAGIKVARAQYFPSLRLTTGYDWLNNELAVNGGNKSWNLRLGLSYPIFNGFQREQQVEVANVQADIARAQLDDSRRNVRAQLAAALSTLHLAERQISLSQEAVTVAEEDLRVQKERYRLGASTILDQLTSESNLTQAQTNLVNARYDYLVARAQLEALVGRSL